MTQEEKKLLLKDLCARLPYGVICYDEAQNETGIFKQFEYEGFGRIHNGRGMRYIEHIHPILRPMSSMTEEEKNELFDLCYFYIEEDWEGKKTEVYGIEIASRPDPNYYYDHDFKCWGVNMKSIDWLNSHHFDFRNLIEKNLALDCTGLHIYY